jgi:hypothetical protein
VEGPHYILRAFCEEQEVYTATVTIVPDGGSYPVVGQTMNSKWKVMEILNSPEDEYWTRVVRLR